jgi:leucine dehydrogenase
MTLTVTELPQAGYEAVVLGVDTDAGYRAIVAIHDTTLGPGAGGARLWPYASDAEALTDALRLARAMTYKSAVARLPLGGAKAVIIAPPRIDRERLFLAHGRFVESLGGRYLTAEDVGTSTADMAIVRRETRHVAGVENEADPSPFTAHGVFRAMQAAGRWRWHSDDLSGRTVALQGCGNVGSALARELHQAGARLLVSDVNRERAERLAAECGATAVPPGEIIVQAADVLAPCALGGVLNERTIPQIRAPVVAGAANNQLAEPRDAERLAARRILYAPDFVANAGGVLSAGPDQLGWPIATAWARINAIYDTTLALFGEAERSGVSPHVAAERLAEGILREAREKRTALQA